MIKNQSIGSLYIPSNNIKTGDDLTGSTKDTYLYDFGKNF